MDGSNNEQCLGSGSSGWTKWMKWGNPMPSESTGVDYRTLCSSPPSHDDGFYLHYGNKDSVQQSKSTEPIREALTGVPFSATRRKSSIDRKTLCGSTDVFFSTAASKLSSGSLDSSSSPITTINSVGKTPCLVVVTPENKKEEANPTGPDTMKITERSMDGTAISTVPKTGLTKAIEQAGGAAKFLEPCCSKKQEETDQDAVTPSSTPGPTPKASPQAPRRNPFFTGEPNTGKGSWLFTPQKVDESQALYEARVEIEHLPNSQIKKTIKYVPRPSQLRELNFWSPTSM